MPEVKRQHFVPRFYLRNFTQDGKRLFVFDKPTQKSFSVSINSIASRKRFYDWTQEHVQQLLADLQERRSSIPTSAVRELDEAIAEINKRNTQFVETHLAGLESRFSRAYRDLVDRLARTGTAYLSTDERHDMSFFIALQFFRTLEQREFLSELLHKSANFVIKMSMKIAKAHGDPDLADIDFDTIDRITVSYNDEDIRIRHTCHDRI
jgi:hypothetical protein